MAVNPIYEKLASVKRINPQSAQVAVDCLIHSNEEILNVLGISAETYIKSCNLTKNGVEYSGVVNFKVMFNNSNNVPQVLNYMAEFTDRMSVSDNIMPTSVTCVGNVVDAKIISSNADSIKVNAIVEVTANLVATEEINALTEMQGENVFSITDEFSKTSLTGTLDLPINVSEDIEINDSVSSVLSVNVCPVLKSVQAGNGFIKVNADAEVEICYVTDGENATVRTHNHIINIMEELSADYVQDSSLIEGYLVNNVEALSLNTNLEVDKAIANVSAQFKLTGFVYNNDMVSAVTDLFSTENELSTSTTSFDNLNFGGTTMFSDKISCTAEITDDMPFADEVLAVCESFHEVTNSFVENGKINLEGIVNFNVLYFNRESMIVASVPASCPFAISSNLADEFEGYENETTFCVGDISFKCRRGKEVEINANIYAVTNVFKNGTNAVITNVEVGEEKPENNCPISIYFVQPGNTIWDVAKKMNVSPDVILEQNPELELPLVGGEKIFIFRNKNIEF